MSVAIVINEEWEVARCLPWAVRFARATDEPLAIYVLCAKRDAAASAVELTGESAASPSTAVSKAVLEFVAAHADVAAASFDHAEGAEDAEDDEAGASTQSPALETGVVELTGDDPARAVLGEMERRPTRLLILPRHASKQKLERETAWQRELFLHAPCEAMQLRPGNVDELKAILVPADGNHPSQAALRLAQQFAAAHQVSVTALYVEPDVGEMAREVGERIINRIVKRTIGADDRVETKVVVAGSVRQAIADSATDEFGLLLLGGNRRGLGRRWLRSSVSETLMARAEGPAVAVLRPAIPLASRLKTFASRLLKSRVPQLDREQRISLVERIQGSSQWDFDFVALILLSTLIATLGLLQSSAAVVIGAMLVAPLMTPLVGAGLSLVQGNRVLIRRASATVLKGFLVAFVLALAVGWLIPSREETPEMLARGSPTVLDFVVALVSGVAASYALGRPNLLSALPGVAIAAALVPPIATAGLALSMGNISLTLGALLLFTTNIVAIVLGTAAALWSVGVRASHEHGITESWVVRVAGALLILAVVIGAYEMVPHPMLPAGVAEAITGQLADEPQMKLMSATRTSRNRISIVISSNRPLDEKLAERIADAVRNMLGDKIAVQIETRLMTSVP